MINRKLCDMLKKLQVLKKIVMHDHFAGLVAVSFGKAALLRETTIQYRQHEEKFCRCHECKQFCLYVSEISKREEPISEGYEGFYGTGRIFVYVV